MKKIAPMKNPFGRLILCAFTMSGMFLLQSCSEENPESGNMNNAVKKETLSKNSTTSKAALTNTIVTSAVTGTGPTYLQSGSNLFTWTYTGTIANPDLDTIVWWYSKVNGVGAPYAIGWGSTGYFMSVPDTFFSDPGLQTSDFKIYITIKDTSGNLYQSYNIYNIMKKGKWKLENSL
ncbi:hypothetical protein ASE21_20230 [Flavobacterium sp. Root901]|uniref:hypothetical protein n=1 Tax=Flavobacterium sp. Root901 TaxID=1736605 RepID=UPI0007090583|nr:hypothetical protein [Flavobacterium sp. Root901]KRD06485.1 hypothetical protein ASE21_20230 [Flavobacterium sp. Root901]